jgi:ABC-type nitrate/sulfonate/bicarbonate transport system substrate-binding protein
MQRWIYQAGLWLALCAVFVSVSACGSTPTTAPADEATAPAGDAPEMTDVSMRFQWIPQWQFAGYIAAEVNGYYDEAGLNVTLNGGGPDFQVKQIVASGAEQFGTAWVDSMYLSQQRGVPLVSLATLFQVNPSAYMVHADSSIEDPEDFVGKTVAVYYGGGVETEYLALLEKTGVDRDQINEVPGQFSVEPFLQRRIDVLPVYATDQPNTVRNLGEDIRLIYARDYDVVMMGDVLFATSEFVEQHPNTVRAFVHASLEGWNWAAENPDEAVAMIAEYNPQLDPDQLAFEAEQTIELLTYGAGARCIGWNDREAWETEEQMLLDLELLEEPVPFEQVANNTFVDEYYQQQGIDCADES